MRGLTLAAAGNRIKQVDIPKFLNGLSQMLNEDWVISFERYWKVIRVTEDDHILTAFGMAMMEKAGRWWQYAEKTPPSPNTRECDKRHLSIWEYLEKKKDGCTDKLRAL